MRVNRTNEFLKLTVFQPNAGMITRVVLCLSILVVAIIAKAQPFTGAELTYTWLSDTTYEFKLKMFATCGSTPYTLPPTAISAIGIPVTL